MKAIIHKEKRYVCSVVDTLIQAWSAQRYLSELFHKPLGFWEVVSISDLEVSLYKNPDREGKLYYYKGV